VRSTRASHATNGPSAAAGLDQAIHHEGQPGARTDHARPVDPGPFRGPGLGNQPGDDDDPDEDHRDVDEEDPAPPCVREHPAAEDRSDGQREEVGCCPDADRPWAFGLVEQDRDHRQRHHDHGGAGSTEDRTRQRQEQRGRSKCARRRRRAEYGEGPQEHSPPPETVAEQAHREHGGCQCQRVRRDEPLELALRSMEGTGEGRQREAQDGPVKPDGEQCDADPAEGEPSAGDASLGVDDGMDIDARRHGSRPSSNCYLLVTTI
jgi:hypothetical protein